jgi:hypothetical protein
MFFLLLDRNNLIQSNNITTSPEHCLDIGFDTEPFPSSLKPNFDVFCRVLSGFEHNVYLYSNI